MFLHKPIFSQHNPQSSMSLSWAFTPQPLSWVAHIFHPSSGEFREIMHLKNQPCVFKIELWGGPLTTEKCGGHSYPLGQEDLKNLPRSFQSLASGTGDNKGLWTQAHVLVVGIALGPSKWLGAPEFVVLHEEAGRPYHMAPQAI